MAARNAAQSVGRSAVQWWDALRSGGLIAMWGALLAGIAVVLAVARPALAAPQRIRLGDTCVGSLQSGQTSFPFYAVEGTELRLTIKTGGGLAVDAAVYDPSGVALPAKLSLNSMGDRLSLRGQVESTGDHLVVIEARTGTSGTYKMKLAGRAPTALFFDGDADTGVEQWFDFAALAGTQVASITVRRVDTTLSFSAPGALEDSAAAAVVLGRNKAKESTLTASRGTLASDGTYRFRFAPTGTGEWTAEVKLLGSATSGTTHQIAGGTVSLTRAGTGVRIALSAPPNGTHFVAGDQGWIGVALSDDSGSALSLSQLSTCNLYLYGPQDPTKTVTAVNLLRASTDRNAESHHCVDLKSSPDALVYGNVVLYPLSAVSSEASGTYTAGVWAVLAGDATQQWFPLADVQIGTATAEAHVVEKSKCASCHLGPISGKIYVHHIDPVAGEPNSNPQGNHAIDSWPTRTCKSCHNNAGYAAYDNRAGGNDANVSRTPDPIVRRVHGVHMGEGWPVAKDSSGNVIPGVGFEGLRNPFNTDPLTGDFRNYVTNVVPADIRNCTICHVDDRWKTNPSIAACGSCHDASWFGNQTQTPTGWTNHGGGERADGTCTTCHEPTGGAAGTGIADVHVGPKAPWVLNKIDLSMTPPVNGSYYTSADDAAGVTVTVVIHNDAGAPIDHTLVTDANFGAANLFVHGPRARSMPVLTNTATNGNTRKRATLTNAIAASGSPASWNFAPTDTFKLAINGGAPFTLTVPGTTVTPAQVVTWLNAHFTSNSISALASVSATTKVKIDSTIQNWQGSRIEIYGGPVTTAMGWKPLPYAGAVGSSLIGTTMEPYVKVGTSSYPNVDLRQIMSPNALDWYDPDVTRTTANIAYPLRGKFANLAPGTYVVYFYCNPSAGKIAGLANKSAIGLITFQVGAETPEPTVATNCGDCHGTKVMHLWEANIHPAQFDPDYCKACHDYSHYETGDAFVNQGGTSTNGWSGFGAVPIVRRVHGVHRGGYLEHAEEIYANANPFGEVKFPVDIRNCTKCHAENDTWKQKPARLACLACHDDAAAKAHGAIMTYDPTPLDPYGTDGVESCGICHGEGGDFAVAKVHNISSPYAPPYPREKEEQK